MGKDGPQAGRREPLLHEKYQEIPYYDSPDGRWLAYSQLEDGNWHLWLRDMATGNAQQLSQAQCNNTEPAWAADSKTLYYASDCGRGLWFSVICKRRVAP